MANAPFQLQAASGSFTFHLDRNPSWTWDKTPMVVGRLNGQSLCQTAPDTLFDGLRMGDPTLLAAWGLRHSEALKIAIWLLDEAGPALVAPSPTSLQMERIIIEQNEIRGHALSAMIHEVADTVDEWDEQIEFSLTDTGYLPRS